MKLVCHLREIRGDRSLREIARAAGVQEADLSRIERGLALPRDADVPALEAAYGKPLIDWFEGGFGLAVVGDEA